MRSLADHLGRSEEEAPGATEGAGRKGRGSVTDRHCAGTLSSERGQLNLVFVSAPWSPARQANLSGQLKAIAKSKKRGRRGLLCPERAVAWVAWGLLSVPKWLSVFILNRLVGHKSLWHLSQIYQKDQGQKSINEKGILSP